MAPPSNAAEAGPCKNKPKSGALSDEDQDLYANSAKFLDAIFNLDIDDVRQRLEGGQLVNVGDENCESTVHKAIAGITKRAREQPDKEAGALASAQLEMLELLVSRGAFVDYADKNGKRPIHTCFDAQTLGKSCCEFLLKLTDSRGERIVELSSKRTQSGIALGNTLLHDACWAGNESCVRLLLATKSFDVEAENADGKRPMHIASVRAPCEVVKMLKDAGADHLATERNGRRLSKETPAEMAESMGRGDTAKYLNSLGKTVNALKAISRMTKGAKADGGDDGATGAA